MQFIQTHHFETPVEKQRLAMNLPADPSQGRITAERSLFRANDALMYRFPSILGYDPLLLKRYAHFFLYSQGYPRDDHVVNLESVRDPESKLLKLLHVRKILINGRVRDVHTPMPYAVIVEASIVKSPEEILPFMAGEEFDAEKIVVLEPPYLRESEEGRTDELLVSSCTVTDYQSESISIKARTNRPGYLVLSEIFYPGWRATVDGKKEDLLCGNYIFRVLPLKAGDHEVRLEFVSWPFRIGAAISLLSLTISLGVVLRQRRRSRASSN
jgi:hypothetical protein